MSDVTWKRRDRVDGDPVVFSASAVWRAEAYGFGLCVRVPVGCPWASEWEVLDADDIGIARGEIMLDEDYYDDEWNYHGVEEAQRRAEVVARALSGGSTVIDFDHGTHVTPNGALRPLGKERDPEAMPARWIRLDTPPSPTGVTAPAPLVLRKNIADGRAPKPAPKAPEKSTAILTRDGCRLTLHLEEDGDYTGLLDDGADRAYQFAHAVEVARDFDAGWNELRDHGLKGAYPASVASREFLRVVRRVGLLHRAGWNIRHPRVLAEIRQAKHTLDVAQAREDGK